MKLSDYKEYKKGKRVTVLGIGKSNVPLISFLTDMGAVITARDKREELGELGENLKKSGVTLVLGDSYLEGIDADVIFRTPGIRPDYPQIEAAKAKGAVVTSEMDLFFELCPCEIFAVTGSDGKTTTTTLVCEMLKKAGYTCHLGGNIGRPLLGDIEKIQPDHKVIVELSSFQLFDMTHSPDVAVITNITPNHLDWHKGYDEYIDAKRRITAKFDQKSRLVVNLDCDLTAETGKTVPGEKVTVSYGGKADVYCDGKSIIVGGEPWFDISKIRIVGKHNVYNYMTAIAATLGKVTPEQVVAVAEEFEGVQHRIEFVRELDGVKYYNSSIDSSPNRTINTLSVFEKNVVLISGGKDKGIPYDDIGAPICEKVKKLILIGKTADVIEAAVRSAGGTDIPEIFRAQTYPEAVSLARENAACGDVVLLSPASTSFDMFNNFEERGELFKKLVKEL